MNAELHKLIRGAIKTGDLRRMVTIFEESPEAVGMNTPFGSWLHVAASFGQLGIVRALVEKYGFDINQRGGVANAGPVHRAAADGHYDVVQYLLDRGAEMDVSEPERNPLFGAIYGGHVAIGKMLIDRGIDTSVRYSGESMKDMSALDFARERGAEEFVALLGG